jgi:7,8-dihydropterin-6-yl-methyl-4-(beta-D-ribofuranosyl)aminobenzene 5'-phosphate synthase
MVLTGMRISTWLIFILSTALGNIVTAEIPSGVYAMNDNRNISITVVYDNNPYREDLETAWGFSCVIKSPEKTILFDTGSDGARLLSNMEKMDIDPEEVDVVVLSHIHGDHVGGLHAFLEKNHEVTMYVPESFPERFKREAEDYGAVVLDVKEPVKIHEYFHSTGQMGNGIKEQALVIGTDRGLIVITGCAHPGIVKIVEKAKNVTRDKVLLVIGGYHLGGKNKDEIQNIISDFRKLGVNYVGPCHCTGDTAKQLFKKEYMKYFINVGVGKIITFEDLK